jgi:hypothetical protein
MICSGSGYGIGSRRMLESHAPCTMGCGKMMLDGYPGQKYSACASCRRKFALRKAKAERERKAALPFLRRTPR